jgi:predicted DNA-binding protein (UPF0251 family)
MGRPHKFRKISSVPPKYRVYIPQDSEETDHLMTMYLSAEEFEALKLRHYDNNKQTDAAEQMEISQTTYSRILARAYEKLTKAFLEGYAISFQPNPSNQGCPAFPLKQRRFRGRKSFSGLDQPSSSNLHVVFTGFGCLTCGFEWADYIDEESKKKVEIKKPPCPECDGKKTYRLIKKLTPES